MLVPKSMCVIWLLGFYPTMWVNRHYLNSGIHLSYLNMTVKGMDNFDN